MADEQYMKRLKDLENPLAEDNPIFLPARLADRNSVKDIGVQYRKPNEIKFPPVPTEEERARTRLEYLERIQLPATITLHSFPRCVWVCQRKNPFGTLPKAKTSRKTLAL